MVSYLGKYILEYKYEAGNVVGEAPKICNFCNSCRVQGAIIEVVEFKSNSVVSNLYSATKMWRRNLLSIFSFSFRYRFRYNQFIFCELYCFSYVIIGTCLSYIIHSSHVLNWQLEETTINEYEDIKKSL